MGFLLFQTKNVSAPRTVRCRRQGLVLLRPCGMFATVTAMQQKRTVYFGKLASFGLVDLSCIGEDIHLPVWGGRPLR